MDKIGTAKAKNILLAGENKVAHPENWVRGHFFQISMIAPPECVSRNPKISFAPIWNCLLEKKMVKGPKNHFEGCCQLFFMIFW